MFNPNHHTCCCCCCCCCCCWCCCCCCRLLFSNITCFFVSQVSKFCPEVSAPHRLPLLFLGAIHDYKGTKAKVMIICRISDLGMSFHYRKSSLLLWVMMLECCKLKHKEKYLRLETWWSQTSHQCDFYFSPWPRFTWVRALSLTYLTSSLNKRLVTPLLLFYMQACRIGIIAKKKSVQYQQYQAPTLQ